MVSTTSTRSTACGEGSAANLIVNQQILLIDDEAGIWDVAVPYGGRFRFEFVFHAHKASDVPKRILCDSHLSQVVAPGVGTGYSARKCLSNDSADRSIRQLSLEALGRI